MLPRKSLPRNTNITNNSTNNSNNNVNHNIIINNNKPLIPKLKCNLQAKLVLQDMVSAVEKSEMTSYAHVVNGIKPIYIYHQII